MNKFKSLKRAFSKIYPLEITINKSQDSHYRSRCEFGYSNDMYTMISPEGNKIYLKEFLPARKSIYKLMPKLLRYINQSKEIKNKLFQINFRSNNDNKILVTLIYHKKISTELEKVLLKLSNEFELHVIGRAKNQIFSSSKNFFLNENIKINNNFITLYQLDNTFFQPNHYLLPKMISKVYELIHDPSDLIELYCGCGTFTIPLSEKFNKIFTSENNRDAFKCLKKAISVNHIHNIFTARLSAKEVNQLFDGKKFRRMGSTNINEFNFSHILVDPPRSGLGLDVINFISKFKNIIYISCNQDSYLNDIKLLKKHKLAHIEFFDQFPNTNHIEIISLLTKKS
jgi:tRNA (uracil-5-)-methyltransferase